MGARPSGRPGGAGSSRPLQRALQRPAVGLMLRWERHRPWGCRGRRRICHGRRWTHCRDGPSPRGVTAWCRRQARAAAIARAALAGPRSLQRSMQLADSRLKLRSVRRRIAVLASLSQAQAGIPQLLDECLPADAGRSSRDRIHCRRQKAGSHSWAGMVVMHARHLGQGRPSGQGSKAVAEKVRPIKRTWTLQQYGNGVNASAAAPSLAPFAPFSPHAALRFCLAQQCSSLDRGGRSRERRQAGSRIRPGCLQQTHQTGDRLLLQQQHLCKRLQGGASADKG